MVRAAPPCFASFVAFALMYRQIPVSRALFSALGSGIINVSLVIPMITRQYQVSNSHRSVPGSTMLRGPAGPALAVDRNPFHLNPGATLAWGNRRLHSLLLAEPLSLPCPVNHYGFGESGIEFLGSHYGF